MGDLIDEVCEVLEANPGWKCGHQTQPLLAKVFRSNQADSNFSRYIPGLEGEERA